MHTRIRALYLVDLIFFSFVSFVFFVDLPLLRLVPKSELMAVYRKDSSGGSSQKCEADNDALFSDSVGGCGHSNNDQLGTVNENNNNNNVVNNNNSNSCSTSSNNNNNNGGSSSISCGVSGNIVSNNSAAAAGSSDNFLFNSASPHFMLNNEAKFSPPPSHMLSPRSSASSTPTTTPSGGGGKQQPATRRRVRRRATSSSDPAEQLTEMSVRGLNLFRYACIDDGVYKCLECAKTDVVKTFKNKYSFQRHAFLYHEGCQRKVFPCLVCSKEFSRPDKMKNHMKTVHDCFMPKECVVPKECLFPPPPPTIPFFLSPP